MSKVIVIYDGDVLAYRAAAAIEKRSIKATHLPSGKSIEFGTRTEFKKMLKDKGVEFDPEKYKIEDIQTPEPLENALAIMKRQIININADLFADDYIITLSGKSNFRDRLLLPSKYKGSRDSTIRPIHLQACKLYLYNRHPSIAARDREADDEQIIIGYQHLNAGNYPVIAGIDKDAYAYSGLTLYDFTKDDPQPFTIPEFGELRDEEKKGVKGHGFIWFCFQWLNGDATDDFKPCEIAGVKFGEKGAYKLLKDATTPKEALETVLKQYRAWYPGLVHYTAWNGEPIECTYKEIAQMYFQCARMLETHEDEQDLYDFLAKYEVEL